MSSNEFINKEEVDAQKAKKKKTNKKKKKDSTSTRMFVKIMNGEFLSRDNFISNLPFTFFVGFLLVVMIGWGYYAETVTKHEIQLKKDLDELDAEYFTLRSEFNRRISRPEIARRLKGTGVNESLISPRKIRVRRYVFD